MTRRLFCWVLSLMVSSTSIVQGAAPMCVLDPAQMPASWRPSPELQKSLSYEPWSLAESKDAAYAIESGLKEMIDYFRRKPSAVRNLGDDSIEALIEATYASTNKPEFDNKIRDAARDNLTMLIKPHLKRGRGSARCGEYDNLLPLAIFAHTLYAAGDTQTKVITERANAAYRACGSFGDAVGFDWREILTDKNPDLEDLFDLYIWCLWIIEAELYPDIALPAEAHEFGPQVWGYFRHFPLPGASEFDEGYRSERFITIADLATHIAHIPTGIHRHPLYVEDFPELYLFFRENFYPVLQSGDLDLLASFVDSLRQYGCTPQTDVQVRDGTRYLLQVFHDNDGRWMAYRQSGETNSDSDDYDLIHHPWTAVLGLRDRTPQPPAPGTYGALVRRWLPAPQ